MDFLKNLSFLMISNYYYIDLVCCKIFIIFVISKFTHYLLMRLLHLNLFKLLMLVFFINFDCLNFLKNYH
jgi:hypothetical protein